MGDYEKECFRGIKSLKNTKISGVTLFQLNKKDTPFNNGNVVRGKSTTDYLDYAILISSSEANTPIEEME